MQATESPFAPSARTLRQFAGLWVLFFGLLACQAAFRSDHPTVALVLAGHAVTVGPLGLVKPAAIRPVFLAWMGLAYPIGWVVSHLLLGALFYGLFTPLGWLFRLIGRDALCRRPQVGEMTYWTAKPVAADPSQYLRLLADLHCRLDVNHGVTGSWLRFPVFSVRSWRTPWD